MCNNAEVCYNNKNIVSERERVGEGGLPNFYTVNYI